MKKPIYNAINKLNKVFWQHGGLGTHIEEIKLSTGAYGQLLAEMGVTNKLNKEDVILVNTNLGFIRITEAHKIKK